MAGSLVVVPQASGSHVATARPARSVLSWRRHAPGHRGSSRHERQRQSRSRIRLWWAQPRRTEARAAVAQPQRMHQRSLRQCPRGPLDARPQGPAVPAGGLRPQTLAATQGQQGLQRAEDINPPPAAVHGQGGRLPRREVQNASGPAQAQRRPRQQASGSGWRWPRWSAPSVRARMRTWHAIAAGCSHALVVVGTVSVPSGSRPTGTWTHGAQGLVRRSFGWRSGRCVGAAVGAWVARCARASCIGSDATRIGRPALAAMQGKQPRALP